MTSTLTSQAYLSSSFSPLPKSKRTHSFGCFPRDAGFPWSTRSPVTPPKQRSKIPFHFKSPTPILFASPPSSSRASLPGTDSRPRYAALEDTPTKCRGKDMVLSMMTPPRPGLGYFAFPEGSPPPALLAPNAAQAGLRGSTPPRFEGAIDYKSESSSLSASTPPPPRRHVSSPSRKLEQEEAEHGEEEWVARGGVLRDRFGNVNEARTKKVKVEVERREREKMLKARWDAYEEGWKKLAERCKDDTSSGCTKTKGKGRAKEGCEERGVVAKDIGFADIPWPIWINDKPPNPTKLSMSVSVTSRSPSSQLPPILPMKKPVTLQDLTIDRVEDFLLSSLTPRGCIETPKGIVRRSYLRWHPDKLGWLVESVKDEDVEDVKVGIGVVLESLKRLNGRLRGGELPRPATPSSSERPTSDTGEP